jgi:EpsI family protein
VLKGMKAFLAVAVYLGVLAAFRLAPPSDLKITGTMSPFFQTFPSTFGGWTGEDTPPDERTLEILETRNVLSRNYATPEGDKVHLLLVSSEKDRRVAHPPEVCYLGANYNIVDNRDRRLDIAGLGPVGIREFRAVNERNPNDKQHVIYLYKIGDRFTTNYYTQQLQFAFDRISRKETEVMLIRLAGVQQESLEKFLADLLPFLQNSR